jgi:type IV pilus assembly protein PilO
MANVDLKSPALLKGALGVLLGGGLLGVFFLTHFTPFNYPNRRDQIQALKASFEKKSTELARARASVADLPRFEAEYEQLHQRWEMAAELLPADKQVPALLRKITLAGQQTGVTFVLFRPSPPRNDTYYTEMPVEISVSGNYHNVGAFLAELGNMRRIVTVANVRLKTNSQEGEGTASASLQASAYSLNTAPAPSGAAKDKSKGGGNDARKDS